VYNGPGVPKFNRVKWKFHTDGQVISSPAVADGTVYFGSTDGNLYAVDLESGAQKWKLPLGVRATSSPAVDHGIVYLGTYSGRFYAVDATTGKLKWKFQTEGERRFAGRHLHGSEPAGETMPDPFDFYLSSPAVWGGTVYFGSGDGNVYALDSNSGGLKWKFHTGDVVHASPAISEGTLFIGSWDSYFYALDAASGKEKWRFNNEFSWVITSPMIAKDKVIFATSDSSLFHMVDVATGKSAVRQQLKAFVFASPSVAGDVVYVGVLNGTLEARDLKTGELLWEFQTDASRENRNWVLTADRKFNSPMIFTTPWREAAASGLDLQSTVGSFFSSPLIANGVVYVGSTDGYLYALQ
jgi:outer membrane protein assembly factor BamB